MICVTGTRSELQMMQVIVEEWSNKSEREGERGKESEPSGFICPY